MKLTIVGCAGSFPRPDSAASCYLLEHDGSRILLDLGSGALGPLQQHTDLRNIDGVVLSHLHPDHFADMCGLFVTRRYSPGPPMSKIPVYGPSDVAVRLAQAYGAKSEERMEEVFDIHPFPSESFTVGPFTVSATRVDHPIEAYALRVSAGGSTIIYSGDTAACDGLLAAAAGADMALFEASFRHSDDNPPNLHMSARDAATMASAAGVGRLILTHQVAWHDNSGALAEAADFAGDVVEAFSGMVVEV